MPSKPTIYLSAEVDAYLETEGAVAQVVNQESVLLSSKILAMPRLNREFVVLHELAHLEQLARPGNDPVRALEDEAWEAARARMEGHHFRIRGRAKGALNATAILEDSPRALVYARPWYDLKPTEPIGDTATVKVTGVVATKQMNIESILDSMLGNRDTDYILSHHGNGFGLSIPVDGSSLITVHHESISFMSMDSSATVDILGKPLTVPAKTDAQVAEVAKIHVGRVSEIRRKMRDVRSMKINHVAFRACQMGAEPEVLEIYRSFFGASSVSGPTEFDTYGRFPLHTGHDPDQWASAQRRKGYNVWVEDGVAFATKKHDATLNYPIMAMALRRETYSPWIQAHIADLVHSNEVTFHGIKMKNLPNSTDQSVYFVKDDGFKSRLVVIGAS